MTEENNNLVKTIIKARTEIYYLVTGNDLTNFKQNNILGDIFFFIASLLIAGFITNMGQLFLLFLGLPFLILAFYFYYIKFLSIEKIKDSGEIKSLKIGEDNEIIQKTNNKELVILKADYGSPTNSIDITDKLNGLIKNNKLTTIATNEVAGNDPHRGVVKNLNVKYKHNGLIITKKFREREAVELP